MLSESETESKQKSQEKQGPVSLLICFQIDTQYKKFKYPIQNLKYPIKPNTQLPPILIWSYALNFTQLGALLQLLSCCHEVVNTRTVSLPQVALGLQCVIVAFACHTHYFCLCTMHWIASHLNNGLTPCMIKKTITKKIF